MMITRALVRTAYGGPETQTLKQVELADPDEGQVQVKVHYSAVNPIDCDRIAGLIPKRGGPVDQFPVVDGHELAGTVVKVGPGVSGLAVGDQVFGTQHKASHGAWADYTNVNAAYVSKVPDGFDMQQAGAAAAAIGTTLLAMDTAGATKFENVLVIGGGGGVGAVAIQLFKRMGEASFIAATDIPSKHNFIKSMGADAVLDVTEDYVEALSDRKFDLIFNTWHKDQDRGVPLLKDSGIIITLVGGPHKNSRVKFIGLVPKKEYLDRAAPYLASGAVKIPIDRTVDLERAMTAVSDLHHGGILGKISIKVAA